MIKTVSYFSNLQEVVPCRSYTIKEVLEKIKDGDFKSQIEKIRLGEKQAKEYLQAFTVSGVFTKRRKQGIQSYSGLICLDFDQIDNVDYLKEKVSQIPFTLAAFISPSGNGLKVLVKVSNDEKKHEQTFKRVDAYYHQKTGFQSDLKCKDLARLCFMSYDPDLYWNTNVEVFEYGIGLKISKEIYSKLEACRKFTNNKVQYKNGSRNGYVFTFANNANRRGIDKSHTQIYCIDQFVEDDFSTQEVERTIQKAYKNQGETGKYEKKVKEYKELSIREAIKEVSSLGPINYLWWGIHFPSVGMIYGPAKSGKSTFSEALAIALAIGQKEFFGASIEEPTKVLLVSLEEAYHLRIERIKSQMSSVAEKNLVDKNLKITPSDFPQYINGEDDWESLNKYVKKINPKIIIIDSLGHLCSRQSIEESKVANKLMSRLRGLANENEASVLLIHHTPKDVSNGKPLTLDTVAGSRIIGQETDLLIGVNKTPTGRRYLKVVSSRYSKEPEEVFEFRITKNLRTEYIGSAWEPEFLAEFDGRTDRTNYNEVLGFIKQRGEVSTKEMENQFVPGLFSRGTLFNNLNKLETEGKIEKPANGLYRYLSPNI